MISITGPALEFIAAEARRAAPAECCGLLLGSREAIVEAAAARNIAAGPNRYEIDPADHIAARRDARRRNLEVVGFYHSHPHSPPHPSETDRAEAAYPDHLYLILSLAEAKTEARIYRLEGDAFVEASFVVAGRTS